MPRPTPRPPRLEVLEDRRVPAAGPWRIAESPAVPAVVGPQPPDPRPLTHTDVSRLHSRPGADQVVLLDFDGHVTSGTGWNSRYNGGLDIVTPAWGTPSQIQTVWGMVAEDFSPFDVDVTTEDPGSDGLANTGGDDTHWGIRVVIGGDGGWYGNAGGVAYVGSFGSGDIGCFVFPARVSNSFKNVAEAASHETGHTLGLSHDGGGGDGEYYKGRDGWAPVMGVSYYQPLTQWSKGEYAGANNHEDDLAIITTRNGFGYRPDDHGDDSATATELTPTGRDISAAGVIERNTDTDWFALATRTGQVTLNVLPASTSPDLDVLAELYDAAGNLVAVADPADSLGASLQMTLPAGRYYLKVDGTGRGDPSNGGYSDYASLGQYTLAGQVAEGPFRVTGVTPLPEPDGRVRVVRLAFTVPADFGSWSSLQVTGPTGRALPYKPVSLGSRDWVLAVPPQRLTGSGAIRVYAPPDFRSAEGQRLDQDGDDVPGEPTDFFAGAVRTAAARGGRIAPAATTDFPLTVAGPLTVGELSVRVNLRHPGVGDLDVRLVSPTGAEVLLFDHRGGTGTALRNTRFADYGPPLDGAFPARPPFPGVYRPDGGLLSDLAGADAAGTWALRVTNTGDGSGRLLSWQLIGLAPPEAEARRGLGVVSVNPVDLTASSVVTRAVGVVVEFDRPVNPATLTRKAVWLTGPDGRPVPIRTVKPVPGSGGTQFRATTPPWVRSGNYEFGIQNTVADLTGSTLDGNGDGRFLGPDDAVRVSFPIAHDVFAAPARPVRVPPAGAVTASLAVRADVAIDQLAVEFTLDHPATGDLTVTLIAPDGTEITLADRRPGVGFAGTVLSDQAGPGLGDGAAPYTGDFRPDEGLAALAGLSAQGTWKLRVENTGPAPGTLRSWALYVKPRTP